MSETDGIDRLGQDVARRGAVAAADRRFALAGHPGLSWSILLDAAAGEGPDPDRARERLAVALETRPDLGVVPDVVRCAEGEWDQLRSTVANDPYTPGGPALRVAIREDGGRVLVGAHHGLLDGIGLMALLGRLLDLPLGTSARGVADRAAGRSFLRSAVSRLGEAVARPPARIAPTRGGGPIGDELVVARLGAVRFGTAGLVAAAARAVSRWRREHGGSAGPVVVGVGVARRPGNPATLERRAAFLRIPGEAPTEEAIRRALAASPLEPEAPAGSTTAPPALLRALSGRLGSTVFVSHLGSLVGAGVADVAFFPPAHGRSGVSLGAVGDEGGTTLTLRARRRDFDADGARRFLDAVIRELASGGDGSD